MKTIIDYAGNAAVIIGLVLGGLNAFNVANISNTLFLAPFALYGALHILYKGMSEYKEKGNK